MNKRNRIVIITVCLILAVALIVSSVAGVLSGEKIDCNEAVQAFSTSKPDTSVLYTGATTKDSLKTELDDLDSMLSAVINSLNIDAILYSDEVATMVAKYTAILTEKDLGSLKFKALEKEFPSAYEYIKSQQDAGVTWESITLIPFGITDGDKETFIKACGAGAEYLGDSLLEVILYAPNSYYDALVPALEATHTGTMPSLVGFVMETGLSGSKRIEFLAEKILAIIEPIKASPLTYLCDIIPDFIVNYGKSAELLNSNEKIAENIGLTLPTIDSIVSALIKALGMTAPKVDYDYLASLGTASVGESGGNNGERTIINGDREAIFQYLADYITGLFTYENNYPVIENILLSEIKNITSAEIQNLIYSQSANDLIAALLDILAKNADTPKNIDIQTQEYNATEKDFSSLFSDNLTEERVSSVIDSLDSRLAQELTKLDINSLIFTDSVATVVAKFTAELCGMEFSEISFNALKKSFPEAYNYVVSEQSAGKTWDDIETIPFGITDGDEAMFIRACGAGAEHFGDALALCIMVSPTSYDDGLIPLLESLHTGPMPKFKDFVALSGLDGAKRMEDITRKVLSIIEPLKAAPISYLCEVLPDVVMSYNTMSEFLKNDPSSTYVGLTLHPLDELIGELVSPLGLTLPDYDLASFSKMATAVTEESGDRCSLRMSLYGDREVVFMSLVNYVIDLAGVDGNFNSLVDLLSEATGWDWTFLKTIFETSKGLA